MSKEYIHDFDAEMARPSRSEQIAAFIAELQALNALASDELLVAARAAKADYEACIARYGSVRNWRTNATRADQDEASALSARLRDAEQAWHDACDVWHAQHKDIQARYRAVFAYDDVSIDIIVHSVRMATMERHAKI